MNIRLEDGAGERIASRHDAGADLIEGAGSSAPGGVDGGDATPELLAILSAVTTTAHEVGMVQAVLGERVRAAAANITATDAEVAESFALEEDS